MKQTEVTTYSPSVLESCVCVHAISLATQWKTSSFFSSLIKKGDRHCSVCSLPSVNGRNLSTQAKQQELNKPDNLFTRYIFNQFIMI